LAGLILIAICLLRALAGGFKPGQLEFAENTTLYWHFVDLVWLILFPVIYLL
jgi:cytochrome c oxidase subunit 3